MALRIGWEAVCFAIAAMLVISVVLLTLGHVAIAAILPAATPERDHVASLAWRLLVVGAFCLAADGAQNVAMGALRGLNQGRLTITVQLRVTGWSAYRSLVGSACHAGWTQPASGSESALVCMRARRCCFTFSTERSTRRPPKTIRHAAPYPIAALPRQ
jgi:MATE family multidrug resistance protein